MLLWNLSNIWNVLWILALLFKYRFCWDSMSDRNPHYSTGYTTDPRLALLMCAQRTQFGMCMETWAVIWTSIASPCHWSFSCNIHVLMCKGATSFAEDIMPILNVGSWAIPSSLTYRCTEDSLHYHCTQSGDSEGNGKVIQSLWNLYSELMIRWVRFNPMGCRPIPQLQCDY